jgi:23S rRNA maturation-related 3'-5' exoribonuclease YhaM
MSKEQNEHVESIAAARNRLVQLRRHTIVALGGEYKPGETQENMLKLTDCQAAIDALDDALADEHRMLEHLSKGKASRVTSSG